MLNFNRTGYESFCSTDVTIVHPDVFVPIWYEKGSSRGWNTFIPSDTEQYWNRVNKDAYAVHFFNGETSTLNITGNANNEDYTYLARQFCPNALPYLK